MDHNMHQGPLDQWMTHHLSSPASSPASSHTLAESKMEELFFTWMSLDLTQNMLQETLVAALSSSSPPGPPLDLPPPLSPSFNVPPRSPPSKCVKLSPQGHGPLHHTELQSSGGSHLNNHATSPTRVVLGLDKVPRFYSASEYVVDDCKAFF